MDSDSSPGRLFQTHSIGQGHRAPQNLLTQPGGGEARALRHGFQRHLLVVVIEDLETVVAAISQLVQLERQRREVLAVHALAREDTEMPRRRNTLLDRLDFVPHEISQLHQKDLVGFQQFEFMQWGVGCQQMERIEP